MPSSGLHPGPTTPCLNFERAIPTRGEEHERPKEQDDGVRHIGSHHLQPLAVWSAVVLTSRRSWVSALGGRNSDYPQVRY